MRNIFLIQRRKINMKTTSYEISKKLKEAGFGKSSAFAHFKSKCGGGGIFYVWEGIKGGYEEEFFSYDLETILDALRQTRKRIMIVGKSDNWGINFDYEFNKYSQENESLADTAGRLLLLLHEKNLIKF